MTLYRVTAQSLEVLSASAANCRSTAQSLEVLTNTWQMRMPKAYGLAVLGIGPGVAVPKSYALAVLDDGSLETYDPYWSNVVLLMHCDGSNGATSTVDSSPSPKSLTVNGNAQLSTAQLKFGTAALLLDGTGDYVSAADSPDWSFGTGPFTIEFWTRISSVNTQIGFVGQYESGGAALTSSWLFSRNTTLEFRMVTSGGSALTVSSAWTPTANTWYHLAVDRDAGGTVRTYINGVVAATSVSALAGDIRDVASTPLRVGRSTGVGGTDLNGYIDDLRITKGVCRYGGQFSVPLAAYADYPLHTGLASNTLADVTSTASGAHGVAGTAANTLASVTSAAAGAHGVAGTATNTLASVTSAGTGDFTNSAEGSAAETLAALTSDASGTFTDTGTAANTLDPLTSDASGAHGIDGTADNTLGDLTSAGSGTITYTGTADIILASLVSDAAGIHLAPVIGTAANVLASLASDGAGIHLQPVIGLGDIVLEGIPTLGVGDVSAPTGVVTWPPPRIRTAYLAASTGRTQYLHASVRDCGLH